jgi:hypothetical protein
LEKVELSVGDQILAELIQAGGEALLFANCKLINANFN